MSEYINTLKLKMNSEEAWKIAEKKGDWLWNLVFRNLPLTRLQLMYIEYEIISIKTVGRPALLSRIRGRSKPICKRMDILVNGTTGGVALIADQNLQFERIEITDNINLQSAGFDQDEAIKRAKMLAHKITHRSMGGMHEAEIVNFKSVYRPFYVAFYGDMSEGNKVRYITIPADGGQSHRAR
ncbi:MAG: hypothetical protein ACLU5F_07210 [Anaerovoracaceae bacterium]